MKLTLETIDPTFGDLPHGTTEQDFAEYFKLLKRAVRPIGLKRPPRKGKFLTYGSDRIFITSVLSGIRKYGGGSFDEFVPRLRNVSDLLCFEHDRLMAEYLPDCLMFRVWLIKEKK